MNLIQTTCSMCRDFRDELKCAGRALVVFATVAFFVLGTLSLIVGAVYACIDQEAVWPIPSIMALGMYWAIYKDEC